MVRAASVAAAAIFFCCPLVAGQETPPNQEVPDVRPEGALPFPKEFDPVRYLGKWYEVARMPNPAQAAGTLAVAEYSPGEEKGQVIVKNSAYSADGKLLATIAGKAQLLPGDPPRLAVSFGPIVPKEPNYYVIHVDEEYQHAVVGTPDRKSLWILARKAPVAAGTRESLMEIARKAGFDTKKLVVGQWKE